MHIGRNARVRDCAAHSRISQHQREARRRWARLHFRGRVRARAYPSQSGVFTPLPLLLAPTPTFSDSFYRTDPEAVLFGGSLIESSPSIRR